MSRQEKLAALASTGITKAELDNIDGGTARGTTAIADGDGVLINDAGTMRMTSVETMATYIGTKVGGGMDFIASSGAISNAANVSFTGFDASKYDHYQFWFQYVIPESDNTYLRGVVSSDGGSNYDGSNYHYDGVTDANGFIVARLVGNDTNENGIAGTFYLYAPHNTGYTYAQPSMVLTEANGDIFGPDYNRSHGNGQVHLVAADVDAIRFQFSSGNIASGEITMFGIVNS